MRHLRTLVLAGTIFQLSCGSNSPKEEVLSKTPESSQEQGMPAPPREEIPPATPPPVCCKDYEELKQLDGQRVSFQGTYLKTVVSRRPPPVDLTTPGTVSIQGEKLSVMLEIYYEESGQRTLEEIRQFHDKKVEVIGQIHLRTPEQMHQGIVMQTMVGPYIEVESISLAVPEAQRAKE